MIKKIMLVAIAILIALSITITIIQANKPKTIPTKKVNIDISTPYEDLSPEDKEVIDNLANKSAELAGDTTSFADFGWKGYSKEQIEDYLKNEIENNW